MKNRTLAIIAVLTVFAVGLYWWVSKSGQSVDQPHSGLLFENLADHVNEIDRFNLSDAKGNSVSVQRGESGWQVQDRFGYAADSAKVRQFILVMSGAKVLEKKTSNPENYARLGVNDLSQADSQAVLVKLFRGEQTTSLLVGDSAERTGGASYVRKPGEASSLLVSPAIEAVADPVSWLNPGIVDIKSGTIQAIRLQDGAQQRFRLYKQTQDERDFQVEGVESEQLDRGAADRLSRSLHDVRFSDVIKAESFQTDGLSVFDLTATRFDGTIFDIKLFSAKADAPGGYYFTVSARFDQDTAQKFMPQPSPVSPENQESGQVEVDSEKMQLTAADIEARRKEAEAVNARHRGWVYEISQQQFKKYDFSSEKLQLD